MTPYQKFYNYACIWVSKRFSSFQIDDIKNAYELEGNETRDLKDKSGMLAKQLLKEGRVLKKGFTTKIRPNGKGRIVLLLISREYSQKQSNNRKGDESLTINFEENERQ